MLVVGWYGRGGGGGGGVETYALACDYGFAVAAFY